MYYRMSTMNDKENLSKSKADQFSEDDAALADLFRALSHPARLAILRALASRGECVCGEIVEVLPLAQSTVSQHLKQLRDSGLITGEIDGAKSCYCIDKKKLSRFFALLSRFETGIEKSMKKLTDCC